jgi:hypothetical protein
MLALMNSDFAAQLASATLTLMAACLVIWLIIAKHLAAYPMAAGIKLASMLRAAWCGSVSWRGALERARR